RGYGLDFFPMVFEVLSYDQMNEVASYGGFPTRYPHWRFGMEYERMSKSAEYGLSKIYEMVINTNPSVAYLLEGNSLVEQKLVMAHVYAHVDFFKNNFTFATTNQGFDRRTGQPIRKWIDTMANHGAVVRRWAKRIGIEKVERFIDYCLSLENLIDPNVPYLPEPSITEGKEPAGGAGSEAEDELPEELGLLRVDKDYMASFINPEEFIAAQRKKLAEAQEEERRFPEEPRRDVLSFLIEHAPLERWERDILTVIRREAYYFYPQMQTKIMNEGWASYWHSQMMTQKICDSSEIIEYADRNASVMATDGKNINPYKLGVELYRHIEERWDKGRFGKEWDDCDELEARQSWDRRTGKGREKIFEVRRFYNDVTFIDAFLTPEFVMDHKLYAFGYNNREGRWEIETRQFEEVKQGLLFSLTNAGQPFIYVADANHENRGELLLEHDHQGIDLRIDYAREVLEALHRVWRRPIELHTEVEKKTVRMRYDGSEHAQHTL
ncbi:MAG: SpoVR family protein, partial [Deltaproteobacteria bacterium]|nr:SpoVR family protein [Deltaproteobacteria bacterium]